LRLTGRSSANTGGDRKNALIISVSSEVDPVESGVLSLLPFGRNKMADMMIPRGD
jgi:hypothetical protein